MSGKQQLFVEGNDAEMAALGSRSSERGRRGASILLGSIARGSHQVTIEVRNVLANPGSVQVLILPGTDLATPIEKPQLLHNATDAVRWIGGVLTVDLPAVKENEAYQIRFHETGS